MSNPSLLKKKLFKFISYENSDVFFLKKQELLTNKNISDLVYLGLKKRKDLKICMHKDIKDELHNMINFLYKKKSYYPHYHDVDEVYQFIKGRLKIIFFNKKLKVQDIIFLDKKNPIIRVLKGTYHVTIPNGIFSVFHEIKKGPFVKSKTTISKKIYSTKI
jgi:cupin fold WbuC family metalloprotein